MSIVSAWESPTNEGTECYTVGHEKHRGEYHRDDDGNFGYDNEWVVHKIELGLAAGRVYVWDTEGRLRISLPAVSTALEYA